jgi:spermidine synthase
MGAGTIISLLKDNYKINCEITAIEKDDIVIELARKYFNIAKFNSLEIINEDAFNFTSETSNKYDLIISDLFIDGNVPKIFASNEYLQNLKKLLTNSGCIIYNKMTQSSDHKKEFIEFSEKFEAIFPGAATHKVSAYGTENSLLYFNTLPILIEEPNTLIKNTVNQGPVLGSLKPAFNYIKNVSFS